jgi:AcrR family transcriptional regulator
MTEIGLREAKRAATAHALAQAAFELARERGVDGFTIDEVATRAGYSRRTFANHYASKDEAIVAVAAEQVRQALDTTPNDDLPLVDWLHAVARRQLASGLLTILRELRILAADHPSLRPHLLEVQRRIRETAREAAIARLDDRAGRVYADLLVGAAYGALSGVLDGHIPIRLDDAPSGASAPAIGEAEMTLDEFLDRAFTYLRTGF